VADGDFDYLNDKPRANPIYIDKKQGSQTETPHANVIDGVVYMTYYHFTGAGMSSKEQYEYQMKQAEEAVQAYLDGKMPLADEANVEGHW